MTGYVCITCNMNCTFAKYEYDDNQWVYCPYSRECTDLVEEDE